MRYALRGQLDATRVRRITVLRQPHYAEQYDNARRTQFLSAMPRHGHRPKLSTTKPWLEIRRLTWRRAQE